MKCGFCESGDSQSHVVITESKDGHVHCHGPLEDKAKLEYLVKEALDEFGVVATQKNSMPYTEIVFHNRQRIGDMFMFTCAIRDFKKSYPNVRVGVVSTCGHIWDHNPHIDRSIDIKWYQDQVSKIDKTLSDAEKKGKAVYDLGNGKAMVKIGPTKLTNSSNRIDWHFANAFRVSMEAALGVHIEQGESRGEVWFTEEEYNSPRVTDRPYWIIITGGEKGWGCKMYPTDRWQKFVEINPDILFYQLGAANDNHVRLRGSNVVDYIGRTEDRATGLRDLLKLFLNAEGSIGLVSFHMHLSGALHKPCVVVAGAREPVSFTRYAGHQYIATDGALPCATKACWHCAIEACTNPVKINGEIVPKCVDMIEPEEVSRYFNKYYVGGRLTKSAPSTKPDRKIVNVVKSQPKVVVAKPCKLPTSYQLEFGGGSITENDWDFIKESMEAYACKSVLEFGAGLSTLLLNDVAEQVVSYEDKQGWIDKIRAIKPNSDVRLWDGQKTDLNGAKFDIAFVDGPAGGIRREYATKIASERAKVVIVHDAGREHEKAWQEKYLAPYFDGPKKGGHRCHLWIHKGDATPSVAFKKKTIKFVSTARGWGGCARSITTMMKLLLKDGHKVEFIPFRNVVSSSEFKACIKNELQGLKITESYATISEPCDVFFMYADDYIWEFSKPDVANVFSKINPSAKRIMTLNYRRGEVGKADWTKGWDKYLFLNSYQESELKALLPGINTKVLASCTDISSFLDMSPKFNGNVRIVRHSSQGDTKYDPMFNMEVDSFLSRQDLELHLMPAPSFLQKNERIVAHAKNTPPISEFLASGNLFWYSLPKGYMDMGPRTIIEAMAVGLPVIADNWGGAVDRVTPECGWLTNTKKEQAEIIKSVTISELEKRGNASKERAWQEFSPKKWLEEIL